MKIGYTLSTRVLLAPANVFFWGLVLQRASLSPPKKLRSTFQNHNFAMPPRRASYKKKRPSFKRKTYKRKSYSKKRSSYKRSYVKKRRGTPQLRHVTIPRAPSDLIPKTADRMHTTLNHKLRGHLTWANTAERFMGMAILPTYLGVDSSTVGPFQLSWPVSGTNVLFPHTTSTTPGFRTLIGRFSRYYITQATVTIKVTRQDTTDGSVVQIGMVPLTGLQYTLMLNRNTALSPTANNSLWIPAQSVTTTIVATSNVYDTEIMALKQQPYVKQKLVGAPIGGGYKQSASISQTYSAKKFSAFGYPFGDSFNGTLPVTTVDDGTPPTSGFYHYFFMYDQGGNLAPTTMNFDIDMSVTVKVTMHRPGFASQNPLYLPLPDAGDLLARGTTIQSSDGKEEKKMDDDSDDVEDLVDPPTGFNSLSLSTPKSHSPEAPLYNPPLFTCLNPNHPPGHIRSSTCI